MAIDYTGKAHDDRPPNTTEGLTGPMCRSMWNGYGCTLDRGHAGPHIADGILRRCAEWDEEEAS